MIEVCLLLACVVGFSIGCIFCEVTARNKPKTKKKKRLEELSDKELFALHMAVFNEISRRGAALIEPFEEFKKK